MKSLISLRLYLVGLGYGFGGGAITIGSGTFS
jgi:hypothetical protein